MKLTNKAKMELVVRAVATEMRVKPQFVRQPREDHEREAFARDMAIELLQRSAGMSIDDAGAQFGLSVGWPSEDSHLKVLEREVQSTTFKTRLAKLDGIIRTSLDVLEGDNNVAAWARQGKEAA